MSGHHGSGSEIVRSRTARRASYAQAVEHADIHIERLPDPMRMVSSASSRLGEKRADRFGPDRDESRLFDFRRNVHHLRMKAAPLCLLGALAACQNSPPVKPKQLLNIEFAGSPECLAGITNKLLDMDMGLARAPVWSKGIGKMEMGPIDRSKLPTVIAAIGEQACAKDVRTRPCATPLSDVVICPNENP